MKSALGWSFRFVELADDVNDHMPDYVVQRLAAALYQRGRAVKGSRVLLLGLAYRPNTSDLRESPALVAAERLLRPRAEVRYADEHIVERGGDVDSTDVRGALDRAGAGAPLALEDPVRADVRRAPSAAFNPPSGS